MSNPKTTIAGYLLLVASIVTAIAHFFGGGVSAADIPSVLGALGGVGLVAARDGGH